jgi:hypothetical protein
LRHGILAVAWTAQDRKLDATLAGLCRLEEDLRAAMRREHDV